MVDEAVQTYGIQLSRDGKWLPEQQLPYTHDFIESWVGWYRLDYVANMATQRAEQEWEKLADDPAIVKMHGPRPLENMVNVPMRRQASHRCVAVGPLPFLDAAIATLHKSAGTKLSLLEKWPGLEGVVRNLQAEHAEARGNDESASFNDVLKSFYDGLARQRRFDIAAGIEPTVPEKVAHGWFCKMKIAIGIEDAATGSSEVKRVDPVTNEDFFAECHRKCEEFNIPLLAIMSFDEFIDFRLRVPSRVQITRAEKGVNAKKRVRRKTTSRLTVTCAVLFSLLRKGKVLVMMSSCSKEQQRVIRRDFGDKVILVLGEKWMNCSRRLRGINREFGFGFVSCSCRACL